MKAICTIIQRELKKLFLDRRTFLGVVVLPGLVLFLVYTAMAQLVNATNSSLDSYVSEVVVVEDVADPNSAFVVDYFQQIADTYQQEDLLAKLNFTVLPTSQAASVADLITSEAFDLAIQYLGAEAGLPVFDIHYDANKAHSSYTFTRINNLFSYTIEPQFILLPTNVGEAKTTEMTLAIMLPMIIVVMLIAGAMTICADSIAGEKERKTLGLLILAPISRAQIAIAKVLANGIIAIMSALGSFLGLIASLPTAGSMFGLSGSVSYAVTDYLIIFLVLVSGTLLIVSILSLISTFARSTKEATSFIMPIYIIGVIGAMIPSLSTSLPTEIYHWLIPIYNLTLSLKAILTMEGNWGLIACGIISNVTLAVLIVYVLTKLFKKEKVLFN